MSRHTDFNNLSRNVLFDVSHVVALVTGGGSGIGLMISEALVANGAKVYITGRSQEKLDAAIKHHDRGPGSMVALQCDITRKQDVERIVKQLEKDEPKGIQLLVNNAGINKDKTQLSRNPDLDMTDACAISDHFMQAEESDWAETFKTNVTSQFFVSMALLPLLQKGHAVKEGHSSSIVNVSSISGAMKGPSGGMLAYAASKAAFTHLGRMLASVIKDTKVRCNTIAPGLFPSEMTSQTAGEGNHRVIDREVNNVAGRSGSATDLASTILLLAGHGGSFYNSQIFYPDGGMTLIDAAVNN